MKDLFVPIKDYETLYLVSRLGYVYSCRSKKVLKPIIKDNGYACVILYKNHRSKSKYIHILVASTFLEKNSKSLVVNHKDLNKLNNCVDNLEYITQKENIYHSKMNGRQLRKKGKQNSRAKKVLQYDLNGNFIKEWDSVMDIERSLGFKSNYISNCALGKCKTSCGYSWKYKN